jgi:hypothetical protein
MSELRENLKNNADNLYSGRAARYTWAKLHF